MSFFKGPYLRVLTPRTTDGINLKYDDDGSNVLYDEQHLPLTAKKIMEKKNDKLPPHLRKIIETVGMDEGAAEKIIKKDVISRPPPPKTTKKKPVIQ